MTTSKANLIVHVTGTDIRHETNCPDDAAFHFKHYSEQSDNGNGACARETVSLFVATGLVVDPNERGDDGPVSTRWQLVARHVGYTARLRTMDGFMSPEITNRIGWYVIETTNGTSYIPVSDVGVLPGLAKDNDDDVNIVSFPDDATEHDRATIRDMLRDFVHPDNIQTVERIDGYGARLSASGYMDCTDWIVCDTDHDAIVSLVDAYENPDVDDDAETLQCIGCESTYAVRTDCPCGYSADSLETLPTEG